MPAAAGLPMLVSTVRRLHQVVGSQQLRVSGQIKTLRHPPVWRRGMHKETPQRVMFNIKLE